MPLTPADVHNVVFKKPPIGKRGYDEDEVDAFLDVVEAELARLIEENNELRAGARNAPRMEEAPAPAPTPAPVAAAPRRPRPSPFRPPPQRRPSSRPSSSPVRTTAPARRGSWRWPPRRPTGTSTRPRPRPSRCSAAPRPTATGS